MNVHVFDGVEAELVPRYRLGAATTTLAYAIKAQLSYKPGVPAIAHFLHRTGLWLVLCMESGLWETAAEAEAFAKAGPPGRLGMRGVPKFGRTELTAACPVCHQDYVWDDTQDAFENTQETILGKTDESHVQLFHCTQDMGVVGMVLHDSNGGTLYVPSSYPEP